MASCDYCGSRILFGGVKAGPSASANGRCTPAAALLEVSQSISDASVQQAVWEVRPGRLPGVQRRGPETCTRATASGPPSS